VYLDGDGTPWVRGRTVAKDPTPRTPLVLDLMAQDPAPSLYLARPCYAIEELPPACTPDFWTYARYGSEVVASMRAALARVIEDEDVDEILLIGYSGGGTLAMLLAPGLAQVRGVVTVAGNLDIDAWAVHHGYSRLTGSLNPIDSPPLPPDIFQVHYVGGRDRNVPPQLVVSAADRQVAARVEIVPEFDHVCCWTRDWSRILTGLEASL